MKDKATRAPAQGTGEQKQAVAALGKRDFLERFGQLSREFDTAPDNPGSYACEGCQRCTQCMFCRECEGCYQCTHCTRCEGCNGCSHCTDCKGCHACAYCVQSERCSSSAYLTLCRNLSDCNYCFGCVGLAKRDFHILNVPFPRSEYFQVVARLRKELGLPG